MPESLWSAVDAYFCQNLIAEDPGLLDALRDSEAAGLPPHHVSATQGKLLQLLARMTAGRWQWSTPSAEIHERLCNG